MARMTDVRCTGCGAMSEVFCALTDTPRCPCGEPYEQLWWQRRTRHDAEWAPNERVLVFRKPDGTFSYPARNDRPTPAGYERVEIGSDRQMAKHEREANVVHERRHYDSNGRGLDDRLAPSYHDAIKARNE